MLNTAPIVLFVYNRLDHTKKTIEALQENLLAEESELYIYADAAKNDAAADTVQLVRSYLSTVTGFKNIHIRLRETNLGVDENVILGVTEVINEKGRVIVLEDDLVTSVYFLKYMNEALAYYEHQEQVISIHGYSYPVKDKLKEAFFLKGADCWGWATWKRGWDLIELEGQRLFDQFTDEQLKQEFNFENTYPYVAALEQQAKGNTSHWDIRWYASAFLRGKLTLYPGQSLVRNIGHDASGTHCGVSNVYDVELAQYPVNVETEIVPDQQAYLAFAAFLRAIAPPAPRKKKRFRWISKILGS
ncbi:MAG: glycosyltransferase family 2 protein [Pedobacter sp.]|uniref:glycosyltransferase family 2 protein n=1 Tax=Pedobacter sp. TaxID=1411316 RepID=UPI003396254A